jgi:excisionase family DNA binding protein
MDDYLMSVSEAAKRLKTDKNFVYDLVDRKLLNALKLRSLKIRNTEINRFLKDFDGKDLSNLDNIKEL